MASPQEREELFAVLEEDNYNEEEVLQLLDGMANDITPHLPYNQEYWKPIVQTIIQRGREQQKTTGIVRKMKWLKVVAAAAVLVLLGVGVYRWLQPSAPTKTTIINSIVKNDISPAGNKAILTLADGSTIVLDTASTGNLVQQGNITIIKSHNGQLVYDASGSKLSPSPVTKNAGNKIAYNSISTPRGGQYQVVLPDGSKVWLNAASSIKFPTAFTRNERSVEVTGEVYFEISPIHSTPFYVKTPEGAITQVLGTSFNINSYRDEVVTKITLVEGSIRVIKGVASTLNGKQSAILKPGQQAQINNTGNLRVDNNADIEQVLAWKNGLFKFNKTNLEDVLKQISRWYDVDITYKGAIPSIKFEGEMNRDLKLSQILEILGIMDVRFSIQDKQLIVMP